MRRDLRVVVGQVVLRQQGEDEGSADLGRQRRLGLFPGVGAEVAPLLPGNVLVGVPVLAPLAVRRHEALDHRLHRGYELEIVFLGQPTPWEKDRGESPVP